MRSVWARLPIALSAMVLISFHVVRGGKTITKAARIVRDDQGVLQVAKGILDTLDGFV